jgi:hypothetical protein
MGFTRSTADQRALLSAAHALGDAALAAEVLSMQAAGSCREPRNQSWDEKSTIIVV